MQSAIAIFIRKLRLMCISTEYLEKIPDNIEESAGKLTVTFDFSISRYKCGHLMETNRTAANQKM